LSAARFHAAALIDGDVDNDRTFTHAGRCRLDQPGRARLESNGADHQSARNNLFDSIVIAEQDL
jgi:hypothetical protein